MQRWEHGIWSLAGAALPFFNLLLFFFFYHVFFHNAFGKSVGSDSCRGRLGLGTPITPRLWEVLGMLGARAQILGEQTAVLLTMERQKVGERGLNVRSWCVLCEQEDDDERMYHSAGGG